MLHASKSADVIREDPAMVFFLKTTILAICSFKKVSKPVNPPLKENIKVKET
jgi:hypothetical protein